MQIFCSKQDVKGKKLMMNNFTLSTLLCLTLLNNNNLTGEKLMIKKMSENDVVWKKLLTNAKQLSQHKSKIQDLTFIYGSDTRYPYFSSEKPHTYTQQNRKNQNPKKSLTT